MSKTEVYSWRLSRELKARLERQARLEGVSLATLLERATTTWVEVRSAGHVDEARAQAALAEALRACIGTIKGGDPGRSARVRSAVRERLARKRRAS